MTCLERTRGYLNLETVDGRYDDAYVLRNGILPSMVDVVSRANVNQQNVVINRASITIDPATEYYQLPPSVQEVLRIVQRDSSNRITADWVPRGDMHPLGAGWVLEGNTIAFRPSPTLTSYNFEIFYISNGDILPHYSSAGVSTQFPTNTTMKIATTPTLGVMDRRTNAYVGMVLRILPGGFPTQERLISAYNIATATVTVRVPFEITMTPYSLIPYEIVPWTGQAMWEAVSASSAMKLGAYVRIPNDQEGRLRTQYQSSIKTLRDQLSNINMRDPRHFQKDTVDNPGYYGGTPVVQWLR